jgi:endo-1,4-beta-xylanase
MRDDPRDEGWISYLLSHHAHRCDLDVEDFVIRVMAEVDGTQTSRHGRRTRSSRPVRAGSPHRQDPDLAVVTTDTNPGNRPLRRRLTPALIAAAVLIVMVAGWSAPKLTQGTAQNDRAVVTGSLAPGQGREPARMTPSPPATPPAGTPATATAGTPATATAGTPATATAGTPATPLAGTSGTATVGAPAAAATVGTPTTPVGGGELPSTFRWLSSAPLISPRTDAHGLMGFKDPTVVRYGGRWHVFITTVNATGYGLAYLSFTRWSEASSATLYTLDTSPMGAGFRAAPQVFYFAPQKLWYLVYQTGNASYSTNPDINNPKGWSAPRDFYSGVPDLISKNLTGGFWVDMWVICDETDCYLFSSDNRGHLFRSQTPATSFPHGMSQPVIAAQDSGQGTSFAASDVYKVAGTGHYLLISQAFGGDGHGYLRSWTSPLLSGPWTPLADSTPTPFAGTANITFPTPAWTQDVVQGELIRDGYDQTLTVNPCHLGLLYLGLDPHAGGNRAFQIGMLTQTNSTCP